MQNVLEYLEKSASRFPEKTAIADKVCSYSFRQLREAAIRLAAVMSNTVNQPIAIFAERSAEAAVLFASVLYSGNYYIPIDPEMPAEKMQAILDDAQPQFILGSKVTRSLLKKLHSSGSFLTLADADKNPVSFPSVGGDDPLYMVYTSGSTGKPKGVLKSHAAEISYLEAYCKTFDFSSDDIIGNQTPFFFDAAAKDLYLMLKTGATIEVLPTELFSMPPMLIEYLNQKKISFISWVPTALSIVAQLRTFSYIKPETLKKVFFVGEVMPLKHLNYWRSALPELQYVNLYGSSEIAGICCYYEVKGEFDNSTSLPMGKPLCNCEIYLLDGEKVVTEPGKVGELYLVSPALATEYYHDPEKTGISFLIKDFGHGSVRCFKTGDLAEYDAEGNLVFASRADYQIKHMGHRIELGEIETVAGALPEVARCCCLYDTKKNRIVLFCQLSDSSEGCTGQNIQHLLRPKLSSYMLPSRVVIMAALPINANGKIDRQQLKEAL